MLRRSRLPMCVTPGIVGGYQQYNAWQLAAMAAALAGILLAGHRLEGSLSSAAALPLYQHGLCL